MKVLTCSLFYHLAHIERFCLICNTWWSDHWQMGIWDSALSLYSFWRISTILTCLIHSWWRNSMTALCLQQTSISNAIKSDVITLVNAHLKNHVLESISERMILWTFNKLWCHLCVLLNFNHHLLINPSIKWTMYYQ